MSFCCCHGDGSDGQHLCTKYHGRTQYFLATMLVIGINCPRLFVVVIYCYHGDGSDGDMCVQSITAIRTSYRLLCCKMCSIA